ncbi:hypothetical protein [Deinococcus aquiradiocola]|uniref:DUF1269 domain-containing protein n=1 Tax=Deinococcus aquiradiocola TaxID=393059 RepID=A0A917UJ72_9DEIO|nr:hypothetical protein [Deinococcus aquiradiocola]GGJ61780.1 hypothetical protein GCM10008939_01940 [Deinococcus aquiradiocola]
MESVVALFREPTQVKTALDALLARGYHRDNLGFTMLDVVQEAELASETGISPEEGAPGGSAAVLKGIGIGTLGGLALTVPVWILLLIIPTTRIYADGGLLGMLFGVLGGAGMGGLFGALAGSDNGDYVKLMRQFGMPARVAEGYNQSLKNGHILVFARAQADLNTDDAIKIFKSNGAVDLDSAIGAGQLSSQRTAH